MADTTKKTSSAVEPYYEYAQQAVDEQAILDKYNAATAAQFAAQREQNRIAENQFYNQMYNTQKTAMDTIRQSNAAAVSSGASRGVQAAQELSSLLGLQQESVASATELAQANRQTAQEETAAMLENVLNAYTQAQQERSTLVQQGVEAQSVAAEQESAAAASAQASAELSTQAIENGTDSYLNALTQSGIDYSDGVITPESQASINLALDNTQVQFKGSDWSGSKTGLSKAQSATTTLENICNMYGLDVSKYAEKLDALEDVANADIAWSTAHVTKSDHFKKYGITFGGMGKGQYAAQVQKLYDQILNDIRTDYNNGTNRKQKQEQK